MHNVSRFKSLDLRIVMVDSTPHVLKMESFQLVDTGHWIPLSGFVSNSSTEASCCQFNCDLCKNGQLIISRMSIHKLWTLGFAEFSVSGAVTGSFSTVNTFILLKIDWF